MRTLLRTFPHLRPLAAVLVVWGVLAPAITAQGRQLNPAGRQDIAFGTLFPGVPTTISSTDALNAGQFEVRGQRNSEVRIDFVLPASLATGSFTLPLLFTAGDGSFSTTGSLAGATSFDPRVPLVARLSSNGRLYLFLGGTVLPGSQQASGSYSGTVTINAAYTGN